MVPPSCHTGGVSRLDSDPWNASWGATHGAKAAGITSMNSRIASATRG